VLSFELLWVMNEEINIRRAVPGDAAGIARVHVDSWRSSYKGIVPDDFLAGLSYERRQEQRAQQLENPGPGQFAFVAEGSDGRVVGFSAGGPSRSPELPYEGELYAIYLLEEEQGRGTGKRLFQATVEELARQGMKSMLLWVFADNAPARAFYERMGGQFILQQAFELGGVTLEEVGYGWPGIGIDIERAK
jgi:GNAT superfamily N-acetyltransferase